MSLGFQSTQVLVGLLFLFSEERMQDPYEILGTRTLAEDAVLVCAFLALRGFVHGPECEAQQVHANSWHEVNHPFCKPGVMTPQDAATKGVYTVITRSRWLLRPEPALHLTGPL